MNYYDYPYPEYDGPVPTPPMCEQPHTEIKVTPALGPVPAPPHTQEPIFPKMPMPHHP